MSTVGSGQTQIVSAGHTSNGTIVLSGGTQWIDAGGTAKLSVISAGGYQYDYGTTSGTIDYGYEGVASGGIADFTEVHSTGSL